MIYLCYLGYLRYLAGGCAPVTLRYLEDFGLESVQGPRRERIPKWVETSKALPEKAVRPTVPRRIVMLYVDFV